MKVGGSLIGKICDERYNYVLGEFGNFLPLLEINKQIKQQIGDVILDTPSKNSKVKFYKITLSFFLIPSPNTFCI